VAEKFSGVVDGQKLSVVGAVLLLCRVAFFEKKARAARCY
jgi:hypothetical protein